MAELRFRVHSRRIAVARSGAGWRVFEIGADGKRSPADFVIPDFIGEQELCEYLADLFHEAATPTSGGVHPLD
jgi:hypothetical protein